MVETVRIAKRRWLVTWSDRSQSGYETFNTRRFTTRWAALRYADGLRMKERQREALEVAQK